MLKLVVVSQSCGLSLLVDSSDMYSRVVSLDSSDDEKETTITKIKKPVTNVIRSQQIPPMKITNGHPLLHPSIPISSVKMKNGTSIRPISNFNISPSARLSIQKFSNITPQFITPSSPSIKPFSPYVKPTSPSVKPTTMHNRKIVRNTVNPYTILPMAKVRVSTPVKIHNQPLMMPIIISTRSLSTKEAEAKPPLFSSELTVTKVKRVKSTVKSTEIVPHVTVMKESKIVDTKTFFNMVKPIPTINLDDDDDDDVIDDYQNRSMEVVEIEFETVPSLHENEPYSSPNNHLSSPSSVHSSSEKENSEPMSVRLEKIIIEQPVIKKIKLTDSIDSLEPTKKSSNDNSSNERTTETPAEIEDKDEIHSTYRDFMDLCLKLDDSEDMKKIVDKRLLHYYKSVDRQFTSSAEFRTLVEKKMSEMTSQPQYMFIYVKEVADELKAHRTKLKPEKSTVTENAAPSSNTNTECNGEEQVTKKKIQRLERALSILTKKINKLEEKEVDYDDENNSAYILADRYKSRVVQIYEKLCKLKGECGVEKKHKNVRRTLSRLKLNDCKVPNVIESLKHIASKSKNWFPDFHEIFKCVKNCASDANLNFSEMELNSIARQTFIEVGTALKNQRQSEEYQSLCEMLINCEPDPADNDPALAAILNNNRQISKKKEDEIINKYADLEVLSKLNTQEVTNENEPSAEESEDDVVFVEESAIA